MDMSWSTARSSSPSLDKPICWAERGEEWADLTKQQTQSLLLASGLSLNSTWIWSDSDPGPSNIDHRSTIHGIHGVRHQTPDTRYQTTDGGGGSWGRVSRVADNGKAQPRSRVTLSLKYVGMGAMKASAKRQIDSWPLWSGKEQPIQVDYLPRYLPWSSRYTTCKFSRLLKRRGNCHLQCHGEAGLGYHHHQHRHHHHQQYHRRRLINDCSKPHTTYVHPTSGRQITTTTTLRHAHPRIHGLALEQCGTPASPSCRSTRRSHLQIYRRKIMPTTCTIICPRPLGTFLGRV